MCSSRLVIVLPGSNQEALNMLTPESNSSICPYEAVAAQVKHDRKMQRKRVAEERLRRQLCFSESYPNNKDSPRFEEALLRTPSPKKQKVGKPIIPTLSPNRVDELRKTIREAEKAIKSAKRELAALTNQEEKEPEDTETESVGESEDERCLF